MKKINIIVVSVLLVVFGIVAVYAVGTNPGSRQDPVVTKSYVDNQINYIKNLKNKDIEINIKDLLEFSK